MARGRIARLGLGITAAAVCLTLSASIALAGEVTGSGKNSHQNQGRSWCSFSGLNDDPDAPLDGSGPNGPGGQSQSYGQDVKLGLADPHQLTPGLACNPIRTFLPPNPNRTH
jgi:hypothetical protein